MKILIAALGVTAACSSTENLGFRKEGAVTFSVNAQLPTPLDILVVLDDTPASGAYLPSPTDRSNVAGVLEGIYNGAPDLRIAVTTTTTGTLRVSPAAPTGVLVHTVHMEDGSLETNYDGTLASALGTLANVGSASTGPNEVFASAQLALDSGFVRDDSGVGILMVSASDDQSTDDAATYASAIQARGNPTFVSAVYSGTPQRLSAFVDGFGFRSVTTFEQYNMSAIEAFSQLFAPVSFGSCLPVDGAIYIVDHHLDCTLVTSHNDTVLTLPICDSSPKESTTACYLLASDFTCTSGNRIDLGGPYQQYHPLIEARCNEPAAPSGPPPIF